MAKLFSDFSDVADTRKQADDRADRSAMREFDSGEGMIVGATGAVALMLDAIRLEIRAGAQLISAAVGAALDDAQRGGR